MTTTRTWKYMQLINKMPCQKIKELYCSCNIVSNGTPIQCIVRIVHTNIINHVWLLGKLHFSCLWQLHYNWCKCSTQSTIILQLMYNINTYDHATCTNFHCQLNMTLTTNYQIWFPLIQLIVPLFCHYRNIIFPLFCDYC